MSISERIYCSCLDEGHRFFRKNRCPSLPFRRKNNGLQSKFNLWSLEVAGKHEKRVKIERSIVSVGWNLSWDKPTAQCHFFQVFHLYRGAKGGSYKLLESIYLYNRHLSCLSPEKCTSQRGQSGVNGLYKKWVIVEKWHIMQTLLIDGKSWYKYPVVQNVSQCL